MLAPFIVGKLTDQDFPAPCQNYNLNGPARFNDIIWWAGAVCGFVSALASLLLISSLVLVPQLRRRRYTRLVLALATSQAILWTAYLHGLVSDNSAPANVGPGLRTCSLATVIWTTPGWLGSVLWTLVIAIDQLMALAPASFFAPPTAAHAAVPAVPCVMEATRAMRDDREPPPLGDEHTACSASPGTALRAQLLSESADDGAISPRARVGCLQSIFLRLAAHAHVIPAGRHGRRRRRRVEQLYHLFVWGATGIATCIAARQTWTATSHGDAPARRCDKDNTLWFFGPVGSKIWAPMTALLATLVLAVGVVAMLLRNSCFGALRRRLDWRQKRRARATSWLLLSFCVAWLPLTLERLCQLLSSTAVVPCWLHCLNLLLFMSQGFFIGWVFGMQGPYYIIRTAAENLSHRLRDGGCCCCCRRRCRFCCCCSHAHVPESNTLTRERLSSSNGIASEFCVGSDAQALHNLESGGLQADHPALTHRDSFLVVENHDPCLVDAGQHNACGESDARHPDDEDLRLPFAAYARRIDPSHIWFLDSEHSVGHKPKPFASGGAGQVYRAKYGRGVNRGDSSEQVVVKLVNANVFDPLAVADFMREATFMTRLQHPHVVHIHGVCHLGGHRLGIVMEYCPGGSMADVLRALPQPVATAHATARNTADATDVLDRSNAAYPGFLRMALQLCRTMAFVHAQDVCHRDLKPDNILLQPPPPPQSSVCRNTSAGGLDCDCDCDRDRGVAGADIKICDWGTARLKVECETSRVFGTPGFTPPEALVAECEPNAGGSTVFAKMRYDGRLWDVFSVAMVLWSCWTGQEPFQDLACGHGPSAAAINDAVYRGERPPLAGFPPRLAVLLRRMWDTRVWARPTMNQAVRALRSKSILAYPYVSPVAHPHLVCAATAAATHKVSTAAPPRLHSPPRRPRSASESSCLTRSSTSSKAGGAPVLVQSPSRMLTTGGPVVSTPVSPPSLAACTGMASASGGAAMGWQRL